MSDQTDSPNETGMDGDIENGRDNAQNEPANNQSARDPLDDHLDLPENEELTESLEGDGISETVGDKAEEARQSEATPEQADGATVLAALQAENADLKDRILRAVAEMENLRKRTRREVVDARTYAITDFARDMLGATDNLERALQALTEDARAEASKDMLSLIEGIEMTEREMQRLMQKNGVTPILAEGEKFNPHKHQAMFEVPDPTVPEGTVVQVMQSGFEIGERTLRPALVGVSKGGPKVARPSAVDPASPDENGDESNGGPHDIRIDKQV